MPYTNRFVCSSCSKPFRSQQDVDRHQSSVHDRSKPYVCRERGCRRSHKGFTRKDNYETHLRCVHKKSSKDMNQVKMQAANTFSQMEPRKQTGEEDNFEGHSREKLTEMVMNEREKCKMELLRRQEVEEELKILRQRFEEREDMWLKLLITKGGNN
ncbi:hypothetical protein N431DRAFT_102141 [Stipitochalara longipes BDJ]|nr:hypothetical protein N431DRAFT_102141 [Stipitochalara longipes BDJ]